MKKLMLAAAIPATIALGACGKAPPASPKEDTRSVSVGQVASKDGLGSLAASGQLVAREEVAVAPDIGGYRVASVLVDDGSVVGNGQVLATLDPSLINPQIAQAQAQLAQQTVAADRARAEAGRVAGLDGAGVISDEAISERRLAVKTGLAQAAYARAQLANLEVQRARLAVRAPRAGRVLSRTVRPGDTAQVGTTMFTIARDGLVELAAELPESAIGGIRVGAPVTVTTASGRKIAGTVRLISAMVDPQSGAVKVRVALPPDPELRPGGFAKASFASLGGAAPSVPESALRYDANGASVQTVDTNDKVRTTPVRTGTRSGGWVVLLSGPPVGTRIVLSGGAFVSDGDRIKPVEAAR